MGPAEYFLVAGVVDDEAELGEDEGEDSGVAEFEPRILETICISRNAPTKKTRLIIILRR